MLRKKRTWRTKRPSKIDSWFRAVWMMAVRRRPRPEKPAAAYSEANNSFVSGIRGMTERRIIVK